MLTCETVDELADVAEFIAASPFSRHPFRGNPADIAAAIAWGLEWGLNIPEQLRIPLAIPRFWAHVKTAGPDDCWPWVGACNKKGYGVLDLWPGNVLAHRFALALGYGWQAIRGRHGLHHCDNPPCANLGHLYLGTQAENTRDMRLRGRVRTRPLPGMLHPNAKMTDAQVREACRLYESGEANQPDIARRFSVSQTWVSGLVRRKHWKHLWEHDDE